MEVIPVEFETSIGHGFCFLSAMEKFYSIEEIADLVGTLATALLNARDLVEIAHIGVDKASRALHAEMVYLSLTPPDGKRLDLIASVGMPSVFLQQRHSIPVGSGSISATAVRTGELQQVPRISDMPAYEEFRPVGDLLEMGMKSYFAMPLVLLGETIGVLSLARSQEGRLSVIEVRLLESISRALCVGLLRARSRGVENKLELQMKAIREAINSIDIETDPRAFLTELVVRACELTHSRYGALGVLNEAGTGLSDFITVGVSDDIRNRIGNLPEGKGLLGAVIRERHAVRVAKLSGDSRSVGFPPGHPPMDTFLGIPLRMGSRIFGNFYLTEKAGGEEFTEEDERMLELFGTHAALAVAHAHRVIRSEELRKIQASTFLELERLRKVAGAIASHDLKNPVQAIQLHIQLLPRQLKQDKPVGAESLDNIERSARSLSMLAGDLLEAARIETGQLRIDRQPTEISVLLPSLIDSLKFTLGNHAVMFVGNGPTNIMADPEALNRIFTNLLVNAAKYSGETQPISVVLQSADAGIEIQVLDKGPGISPEDLPHVFDRFYQTTEAHAKNSGLGLGLFIVRGLVEAHGGRVWVSSSLGVGSVFHVWLPIGEEAAKRTENSQPEHAA
ncbi:MAG: GAF domain-containing sensor histidine kinase [Bdellovibrionota bacterium]